MDVTGKQKAEHDKAVLVVADCKCGIDQILSTVGLPSNDVYVAQCDATPIENPTKITAPVN